MHELIAAAIERSAGLDRWSAATGVVAELSFGGLAFASRFQGGAGIRRTVRASTREPRLTLEEFPRPGCRGEFSPELVWIEDERGRRLRSRAAPRQSFRGLRRQFWWDDLDLLYFAGYAGWNYLTTPFLLASYGVEATEIEPWRESGELWRRLRVRFPASIPTHCAEQEYYFDEVGRLRRFDYVPEVFGSWARAAHYCLDYRRFDGIEAPSSRRVVPRRASGVSRSVPTLVWIRAHAMTLA